ncbi:MAG: type II secretion system F family protein [Planctomycetaceae bacterium]|nr:type II secretion system F family protein [Planctomycetaceae bacterium]
MSTFQFVARQSNGTSIEGVLEVATRRDGLAELARRSLIPIRLQEVKESRRETVRVSTNSLATAYELLADLLESGVPLLRSLDALSEQCSDVRLATVVGQLRARVADGSSLAEAMGGYPEIFPDIVISAVNAGEEGGFLEQSLRRLSHLFRKQAELRSRVLGAMAYPAFLLIVGSVIVVAMLVFFVPRFEPLFARMRENGSLPLPTILLLSFSDSLRSLLPILAVVGVALIPVFRLLTASPGWRKWRDRALIQAPVIGPIVRSLAISRFCRLLGTLLSNGVSVMKSLQIAKTATGNLVLIEAISRAAESVSAGGTLSEPLARSGQFPRDILEIVSVGEQANRLDSVLLNVAERLELRTHRQLDVAVKLLEPLMMMLMAVLVGFVVIALLLPVFDGAGGLS